MAMPRPSSSCRAWFSQFAKHFVQQGFCHVIGVSVSCLYFTVSLIRVHTQCHVGTRITEVLPLQPTDRMMFGAKLKDVFTGSFPRASHQPAPLCTDACCYWFLSMHFLMNQSYLCSIQTSAFFVKGLICRQSYCPLRFR